jgi:adenylate cyclase
MHLGPAMAGVIGHNKPYYDVWGDTINVAARLEAASDPGFIQVSAEVRHALSADYRFESRGMVDIRGKGPMELYFLIGRTQA